jgi:putative Holliday junction resolvase
MDDSEGDRAVKSKELADTLMRRTGLDVVLWDERLTTVEAHGIMNEAGLKASEHDRYVDQIAAALILQDYLDNSGEIEGR